MKLGRLGGNVLEFIFSKGKRKSEKKICQNEMVNRKC